MKKFTKISLIVAAILLGIGILLETIASFLGAGFGELRRLAGNGEFDRGNWHIRENGIYYSGEESWHESEERDAEPSSACEEYEAATVKNMKIHVNAAHIYIQKSKNADKISVALEDGKEKYFKCGLKRRYVKD